MGRDKDEKFLTDMLDRGATVIDASGVHHGSKTHTYMVTTKYKLEVEMTRAVEATHFMAACNEIDEGIFRSHPVDLLRRHGYITDLKQTKHKIVKED